MVESLNPETTCKIPELPQMGAESAARPTATETDRTMAGQNHVGKGRTSLRILSCHGSVCIPGWRSESTQPAGKLDNRCANGWHVLPVRSRGPVRRLKVQCFRSCGKFSPAGGESLLNGKDILLRIGINRLRSAVQHFRGNRMSS